jgi:predicted Zn-dependent protease
MKIGIDRRGAAVAVAGIVLLAGCAATPPAGRHAPPVMEHETPVDGEGGYPLDGASAQDGVAGGPAPAGVTGNPAVVALQDTAERQANAGQLDAAAASLERALRIESRNPVLWSNLALVRLEQGETQQAEYLAVKSNSLAPGNRDLQARNWQIVAQARRDRGDRAGARAAEQRARDLESP